MSKTRKLLALLLAMIVLLASMPMVAMAADPVLVDKKDWMEDGVKVGTIYRYDDKDNGWIFDQYRNLDDEWIKNETVKNYDPNPVTPPSSTTTTTTQETSTTTTTTSNASTTSSSTTSNASTTSSSTTSNASTTSSSTTSNASTTASSTTTSASTATSTSTPSASTTTSTSSQYPSWGDWEDDDWDDDDWGDDDWDDDEGDDYGDYIVRKEAFSGYGTVSADSVRVRQRPSTKTTVVGTVSKGTQLPMTASVLAEDGAYWFEVKLNNGVRGYIRSDLIARNAGGAEIIVDSNATGTGSITGTTVNVRQSPTTGSAVVTKLTKGANVTVTGSTTDAAGVTWYQVNANGKIGYVHGDYIEVSIQQTQQPAQQPTAPEAPVTDPAAAPTTEPAPEAPQVVSAQQSLAILDAIAELSTIQNASALFTPMELMVYNALPFKEQMIVALHGLGYSEQLNLMLSTITPALELSERAQSMVAKFETRAGSMTDAEKAQNLTTLKETFPVYTLLVDGVPAEFLAIPVQVGGSVVYYGFVNHVDETTGEELWVIDTIVIDEAAVQ